MKKIKFFAIFAIMALIISSCVENGVKSGKVESYDYKNQAPKELKIVKTQTLTVVAKAIVGYNSGSGSVITIIFDNGIYLQQSIPIVSESKDLLSNYNTPAYAERDDVCKVGELEDGSYVIVENQTIKEKMRIKL